MFTETVDCCRPRCQLCSLTPASCLYIALTSHQEGGDYFPEQRAHSDECVKRLFYEASSPNSSAL